MATQTPRTMGIILRRMVFLIQAQVNKAGKGLPILKRAAFAALYLY
jgi:hypothetical protein